MNLGLGFPITFGIGIILICVLCIISLEKCCYIVLFMSIFMGVAFLHIGDNSILVYHICSMIFFLKFIYQMLKQKSVFFAKGERINSMFWFLIYCFFSIFFVLIKIPVEIPSVESGDNEFSHFSFQQFTQYMYLFHSFTMMYAIYRLLDNCTISMKKIWKCIDYMYLIVIIIGFLQLLVPIELYNMILKNDANGAVYQLVSFGNRKLLRIDSTFGEPSFLGFFLVPILCMYIYEAIHKITVKNTIFIVCGIIIEMQNQSSTFIIGMGAFIIGLFIIEIFKSLKNKQQLKISKQNVQSVLIVLVAMVVICFLFKDFIKKDLDVFVRKLSMQNTSGMERFSTMFMALQAFRKNPVLGVGFGTMRSMDMLSNWLGQLGIFGVLLYIFPVSFILVKLLVYGTMESNKLLLLILVSNVIMFAAVPEFRFLFIWLYYAMAFFQCKDELDNNRINRFRDKLGKFSIKNLSRQRKSNENIDYK